MSVDTRQSLTCLRFPSRVETVSRSQLSKFHTGDLTRIKHAIQVASPVPFLKNQDIGTLKFCLASFSMAKGKREITIKNIPKMQEASSSEASVTSEVREINWENKTEVKAAALSLAKSFESDDVARYFVDTGDTADWSDAKKWKLHLHIMKALVKSHAKEGLVNTIGPNYDCVALWLPPGKDVDPDEDERNSTVSRSGIFASLRKELSEEGKFRFFKEFMPLLHNTKRRVLESHDQKSWYLVYIGTKPEGRGKGYAKKLVEDVTRQADANGQKCYLESSNAINPKIYAKFGFEMMEAIYLKRGPEPIQLDIMVRHPVPKPQPHRLAGPEHHNDTPN
ncbi:MAG: hypothetical protein Q9167_001773 [Letrouitia subvulpina]